MAKGKLYHPHLNLSLAFTYLIPLIAERLRLDTVLKHQVKLDFIYITPIHNKHYLVKLKMLSRSRSCSFRIN